MAPHALKLGSLPPHGVAYAFLGRPYGGMTWPLK
jgi:hypothetical protein